MITYVENPIKSTPQNLLELKIHFNKVLRAQINTKKVNCILRLTKNQKLKLKKAMPFTSIKNIKYLSINMAKDMQDLYNEKYGTL